MKKLHILLFLLINCYISVYSAPGSTRELFAASDSLTTQANKAAKAGRYDIAIAISAENVTMLKKKLGGEHDFTAKALYDLGRFYALRGDWENAWKNANAAATMWKYLYDGNNINYAIALSDAAYYNARRGNLTYAREDADKSVKLAETLQCENMECYGGIVTNYAYTFMFPGEYKLTIETANKALTAIDKNQGPNTEEYSRALSLLAAATSRTSKNQDEAIGLAKAALDIQNRLLPEYNFERALTLNRLCLAHLRKSDSETALKYGMEAINIWDSLRTVPVEYEDCTWQMAILHNTNRNFEETLRLCNALIEHSKQANAVNSLNYANRLSLAAAALHGLGRDSEAVPLQEKSISVTEYVKSKEYPSLISAYYNLARYQLNAGNYKQAVQTQSRSVKISEKLYKGKKQHAEALSRLAAIHGAGGDYAAAVTSQSKSNELYSSLTDNNDFELMNGLNNLAAYQTRAGMDDAAYATELDILNRHAEKDTLNKNFVTALNNAAIYAKKIGHTTEAKELQRRSLKILKRLILPTEDEYIEALSMMINYCTEDNDYVTAAEIQREKTDAISNKWGKYSNRHANELETYASLLSINKHYDEAIKIQQEVIDVLGKIPENSDLMADAKSRLGSYYSLNGNFEEASRLSSEVTKQTESSAPTTKYAQELAQAATHQQLAGNNAEALRLSAQSLEVLEQTDAKGSQAHARALNDLAGYYAMVHDNKEAIKHARKAVEIYEALADTANLAIALNNLALFHARAKDYATVDSLNQMALQLQAFSTGENSVEYARILNNVATNKFNSDNVEEAIAMGEKAMSIFSNHNMDNTLEFANSLNNQSVYLLNADKPTEALDLINQALIIRKKVLGVNHPDYLHALVGLCSMLESNNQTEELVSRASESTGLITDMLRRQFMSLPAKERASYWNAWNIWYQNLMLKYTQENPVPQMIAAAYEGTIFAKGLMLNSECNLKDLIAESSSAEINNLYTRLQDIRTKLNELYDKPAETNIAQTDSLERMAAALERQLVSSSREYGDYTANLSVPASSVKANLHPGDAAVEFVSFRNGTDNQYYAFLLTAEDTVPKFIRIAPEKDIILAKNNRYELSRTVWTPIAEHLGTDTKQLFFAPAGELYSLPIEYLPDYANEHDYISSRWELHRLSSTRQIAQLQPAAPTSKAGIIGGLTYNTNGTPSPYDLPQTKTEAENIYSQLNPHISEVQLLTGNGGSENAIRGLAGKGYDLLHIATHGFCISEEDADYQACDIFHSNPVTEDHSEDNMLKRSGLMLHGAGPTLLGRGPKDRNNDGVLTAMEIARLDFRGLDLAVLSACQTALGDVTGEGVFGLQRGFKKAGTKSLLMSLWKVDDKATQLLMTRFYANLTSGMTKKASLTEAQQYLRTYTPDPQVYEDDEVFEGLEEEPIDEHPYSSPQYWAAFVLLDAIN